MTSFRWIVLGFFFFASVGCEEEREKIRDVPVGYRGKARVNPYLAAEKYLNSQGFDATSSRTWVNYDAQTGLIFMPASFLQTKGMGMRVLEWVVGGGNLVITIEGGEPGRNDFTDSGSGGGTPAEGDFTGLDHVLKTLGVELTNEYIYQITDQQTEEVGPLSREWEPIQLLDEMGAFRLEVEGNVGLDSTTNYHWTPRVGGGSRLLSVGYGSGEVIFLAHARPLRSPYLARADHAEFLEFLAMNYGDGSEVVFLYGTSMSFFGLLWKEGWMVVTAGLVLLAAWLWGRIPRFGPVRKDLAVQPKPYGEALTASARYLWRIGEISALLNPLRHRVLAGETAQGSELHLRLAEQAELKPEEVAAALSQDAPDDPGHVLKTAQQLQTLLKR